MKYGEVQSHKQKQKQKQKRTTKSTVRTEQQQKITANTSGHRTM